ncbi:hypothetical protein OPQ81_007877 [Rhizoctonia solani]|nr:hypothetical protein OPQ81_007877 [Rhizoctonia solani]
MCAPEPAHYKSRAQIQVTTTCCIVSMTSSQQQNLIHHLCEICGQPTTLWCSRCRSAWYCTSDHLEQDWGRHRQHCRSVHSSGSDTGDENSATTAQYTRQSIIGILFPVDEDRPRLIQLDCRARIDNSTGGPLAWQPVVTNIVNDDHPAQVVLEQGIAGDNLRFPIQLWSRGAFQSDGSPLNQSIHRLTRGQASYPWKGPFIALKFSGTRRQGYVDMSLNDLPALVSHFLQVKMV